MDNDKQFGIDARLHHRQTIVPHRHQVVDEFSPEARKARAEQQQQGAGGTSQEERNVRKAFNKNKYPNPGLAGTHHKGPTEETAPHNREVEERLAKRTKTATPQSGTRKADRILNKRDAVVRGKEYDPDKSDKLAEQGREWARKRGVNPPNWDK